MKPYDPIIEACQDGSLDEDDNPIIVLTCTAHGDPFWRICNLAREFICNVLSDRNVNNPPPYQVIDDPFNSDNIDLEDPTTWSSDPNWNKIYAETGKYPSDWDYPNIS